MERRQFLQYLLGITGITVIAPLLAATRTFAMEAIQKMTLTDKEWKDRLTDPQYDVLRKEGTEAPFTSPLLKEHREGMFACAACGLPLFLSQSKYDSGTGWPSFYQAIAGHVETRSDHKLLVPRTEYHCARCGGHQGHVFEDGPAPTGLRYCNNGVALRFIEKEV